MGRIQIGVIGAGDAEEDEQRIAERVGREIARSGYILVCGGLGGVMEAAARGAHSEGGFTVGILPGRYRVDANPYVDVAVVTGMGEARNAIIARTADALIAVGGGAGTLSEAALGLKMKRPVIFIRHAMPNFSLEGLDVHVVDTPMEAVGLAEKLLVNKNGEG